jgi:carbohydrate-selective porin OprB
MGNEVKRLIRLLASTTCAVAVAAGSANAQSAQSEAGTSPQSQRSRAGYSDQGSLEGPSGVTTSLAQDDAIQGGLLSPSGTLRFFDPWYDWKKRLNANTGLQLSFSFQTLAQSADETLTGISNASATRGQMQGAWTLLNRGGKNPGKLTFRIRNREAWGDNIPPTQLAFQFGSIVNSGTGFGDSGWELNELAWRQSLMDGDFRFIFGVISAVSWYNTTALSSSLTGFQNSGMQSSLSKPGPGRGLGFGLGYQLSPNTVLLGGVHDANSTASDNPLDTIKQGEYFYAAEFRYLPSGVDKQLWDSFKVMLWYQDALEEKGVEASSGVAVAASYLINDFWYPFAFGGWSDGNSSIFKRDFVAGLGIKVPTRNRPSNDFFGIAAGWGDPSIDAFQEQYTAEAFYRLQLLSSFAITPSVQLVRNPAANPGVDQVVLWSLRTRVQF